MGSKMQNGIGLKVFAQVTIKRGKGMGGCHALFKQKPHGVALVAKPRLNHKGHVAQVQAKHKELFAVC